MTKDRSKAVFVVNYSFLNNWSGREDSNLRPSGPKPDALPGCATPRSGVRFILPLLLLQVKKTEISIQEQNERLGLKLYRLGQYVFWLFRGHFKELSDLRNSVCQTCFLYRYTFGKSILESRWHHGIQKNKYSTIIFAPDEASICLFKF